MYKICVLLAAFTVLFCEQSKDQIPCVDLNEYYVIEKREAFLKTIHEALKEYGFFGITNSGIDEELKQSTYTTIKDFFAKPLDEKMKCCGKKTNCQRGYVSFGLESAKGRATADIKEFFHVGLEVSALEAQNLKIWPNIWPEEPTFKSGVCEFKSHLMTFSHVLEKILAQTLLLENSFFSSKTFNGDTVLRMVHYPSYNAKKNEDSCWAAEHTDINLFTILPAATSNGLEVKTRSGKWIRVNLPPSAMIVNAGDFLEIFTNGLYQSSVHRVKKSDDNIGQSRYSMVLFVHPSADTILDPIHSCIALTGGKKKFATATRYEMLMERLTDLGQATDQMLQDLRDSKVMERLILVGRASPDAMKALRKKGYASQEVLDELTRLGL